MQKYGELSLCFHIFPVIASYHGKASWNKDPPFTWVRTSKTGDEIRMASVCGMEGHIQGLRFHCSLGERLNSENRIFFYVLLASFKRHFAHFFQQERNYHTIQGFNFTENVNKSMAQQRDCKKFQCNSFSKILFYSLLKRSERML